MAKKISHSPNAYQIRIVINFDSTVEGKNEHEGKTLMCFNLINLFPSDFFFSWSVVYMASFNILCCDIYIDIEYEVIQLVLSF